MRFYLAAVFCLLGRVVAQQAGDEKPEEHPELFIQNCNAGSCQDEPASIVLDAARRWLHDATKPEGYVNCIKDEGEFSSWDPELCPDPRTCAQNCAVDGVDAAAYSEQYGIHPIDRGVQFAFKAGSNVGTQVYVLENDETYKLFRLKNKEISFDVNLASLPCGVNAAFYLVSMDPTGQKVGGNSAGARFGTGYCDAQCPHQLKFVQGEANMMDWQGASEEGRFGSCCSEIDLWEGNSQAASFSVHPGVQQTRCEGVDCGDGDKGERYMSMCDKDGCDFNSYRLGAHDFYGPGKRVDSMQPFTVVTQFLTTDGTDGGRLAEVKQFYIQNGQVIEPAKSSQRGVGGDSISEGYCSNLKKAFINTRAKNNDAGDFDQFTAKGGLGTAGDALDAGMVLVLSLWDDPASAMRWLDSNAPRTMAADTPGVVRGPCPVDQGEAAQVEVTNPDASVSYSNIRYGEIGSTNPGTGVPGPRAASPDPQPEPYLPPVMTPPPTTPLSFPGAAAAAPGAWGRKDEVVENVARDAVFGQRTLGSSFAPTLLAIAVLTMLVLFVATGRRGARPADELASRLCEEVHPAAQPAE